MFAILLVLKYEALQLELALHIICLCIEERSFPVGASQKELSASVGDIESMGWIPGLGRSPGVGNGSPLQYSCLENPIDKGALWATVHGVTRVGQS